MSAATLFAAPLGCGRGPQEHVEGQQLRQVPVLYLRLVVLAKEPGEGAGSTQMQHGEIHNGITRLQLRYIDEPHSLIRPQNKVVWRRSSMMQ